MQLCEGVFAFILEKKSKQNKTNTTKPGKYDEGVSLAAVLWKEVGYFTNH